MATALLTDQDFEVLISDDHLLEVTGGDNTIWDTAEKAAWRKIVSYLRTRYDMDLVKQNITAYDELREVLLDIMIYNVLSRLTPKHVPEVRYIRFKDAIAWLEEAREGTINPDFPEYVDAEGTTQKSGMQIGGHPAEDWRY